MNREQGNTQGSEKTWNKQNFERVETRQHGDQRRSTGKVLSARCVKRVVPDYSHFAERRNELLHTIVADVVVVHIDC